MTPTPDELLDEALVGDLQPDFDTPPEAPLDLTQATAWVAEVKRLRRLRDEYDAAHRAAVNRLQARRVAEMERLNLQEGWLLEALEMYHRTVIALDKEALTVHTPAGTLKSRMGQPSLTWADEEAFMKWALAGGMPDVVEFPPPPGPRIKKVPARKALKENFRVSDGVITMEDGSVVPGVRWTDAERIFTVNTEDAAPKDDVPEDEPW